MTGSDAASMPPAWRQVVEDVCVVSVAAPAGDDVLRLISDPEPVELSAGETARLTVIIGTDAHADLAVEAHLISPWGTWEWMGPAAVGRRTARPRNGGARLRRRAAGLGGTRPVVGADPGRLRRPASLLARGEGDGAMSPSRTHRIAHAVAALSGACRCGSTRSTPAKTGCAVLGSRRRCRAAAPAKAGSCAAG